MKNNIAVFFGGVSCEHDISILTGVQVLNNISDNYNVFPIYIHSDGIWYTGDILKDLSTYNNFENLKNGISKVCLLPYCRDLFKYKKNKIKPLCTLDTAVLAMHGLNGEDGSLAGLLQLCGIPQTGCAVLGSSLGMDKIATKIFLQGLGLKVLPYTYINRKDYMYQSLATLLKIEEEIGYPMIVKPSMLGSSIGISKCTCKKELTEAIETAMRFDRRILIERAETDFIEINCSALKCNNVIMTTQCERPVNWQEFLKFEDKYLNGDKGMADIKRIFPADIDKEKSDKIREMVTKIYECLNLKGIIRADFIVSDDIYINEINTIPGSLSYYLWDYEGINFEKLIDIIIREAGDDLRDLNKCTFSFKSDVLKFTGTKNGNLASNTNSK